MCPNLVRLPATWPRLGRPHNPRSPKLFHYLSRPSRVPGPQSPGSPLRVRGESSLLRLQQPQANLFTRNLSSLDTARLWGGGRANGGTAPNRLPRQASGRVAEAPPPPLPKAARRRRAASLEPRSQPPPHTAPHIQEEQQRRWRQQRPTGARKVD